MGQKNRSTKFGVVANYKRALISGFSLLGIVFIFGYYSSKSVATDSAKSTEVLAESTDSDEPKQNTKNWLSSSEGVYSVSVLDGSGKQIVEHNSDEQYFMASIYKLYVAYIGYQKIDQGKWNESEIYLNDWTRGKCLDQMIRTSHSPCGEKMLSELGDDEIMAEFTEYGFTDTNLTDFVTSSADVSKMLLRLQNKEDLSDNSTNKILDSMEGQKFRDVLPKVFARNWKVYDKVGFREEDEYHDVGIVKSSEGKTYVVVLLSKNAGATNLVELSNAIKSDLEEM